MFEEEKFFWIFSNFFFHSSRFFSQQYSNFGGKNMAGVPKLQSTCPDEVFEEKNIFGKTVFGKNCNFSFFLGYQATAFGVSGKKIVGKGRVLSKLHSTCPERVHQEYFLGKLSFYKFVLTLRGRLSGCCYSVLVALPNVDSRVQKNHFEEKNSFGKSFSLLLHFEGRFAVFY